MLQLICKSQTHAVYPEAVSTQADRTGLAKLRVCSPRLWQGYMLGPQERLLTSAGQACSCTKQLHFAAAVARIRLAGGSSSSARPVFPTCTSSKHDTSGNAAVVV